MRKLGEITISYNIDDLEHIKKLEETFVANQPIAILGKEYIVREITRKEYMYIYNLVELKRHRG